MVHFLFSRFPGAVPISAFISAPIATFPIFAGAMQVTLIVPELIWPEPADRETLDFIDCPALETLLARSRLTRRAAQSLEATLADAFGQPSGAPYAAFRLLGEAATTADATAGYWLCCDPVHLRFHQEQLILADSASFGITEGEAQTLAGELNRELSAVGRFHVAAPERWYLELADSTLAAALDTPPLSAVAGRRIDRLLPATAAARRLRALHNEAQMLLHAHQLNAQREDDGRLAINSLWLWGGGALPARLESDFDGVWSANPLALGLARAAGVPTHRLPVDAATLFEHAAPDTNQLVVLEDLLAPVLYQHGEAYRGALAGLEARWFAPLRAALSCGKIAQLRIEASTAYAALAWQSSRREQWKLWRRAQPLAALAQELATTA